MRISRRSRTRLAQSSLIVMVLLVACAPRALPTLTPSSAPDTDTPVPSQASTPQPTPTPIPSAANTATPTTPAPTAAASPTPPASPAATLQLGSGETWQGHEVVLSIHNVDKLTGRADQLARWLAWGAPAFTVAPDGSFWLFDLANRQFRLVHLSPSGQLLQRVPVAVSLAGLGPLERTDLAASQAHVWLWLEMLDQGVERGAGQIRQFDAQGNYQTSFDVPGSQDGYADPSLGLGEQGELLLERRQGLLISQLLTSQGNLDVQERTAYHAAGHAYRLAPDPACAGCFSKGPVYVDERPVEVTGLEPFNYLEFLGALPDGSFVLLVMGETADDWVVQHYGLDGRLLGMARPPADRFTTLRPDRLLAIGPDGAVYALVSRPDQDVVILRLRFTQRVSPPPTPLPASEPTPMTPLRPAWSTPPAGAEDQEIARQTLIAFFDHLQARRYAEAAALYGGSYDEHPELAPFAAGADPAAYWETACRTLLACLSIGEVVEAQQVAAGEFRFLVELVFPDGFPYVRNGCCLANPAELPPAWLFPYTVKKDGDRFQVLQGPPILE